MADQQNPQEQTQIQFLLSDFNTRLKDSEERNQAIRERVLLLGKNLITSKEEVDTELQALKKQTSQIKRDLKELKSITKSILTETNNFVRKDEMLVVERMLKDFQPLEFMRKKDVEELINQKSNPTKQIKTSKTTEK